MTTQEGTLPHGGGEPGAAERRGIAPQDVPGGYDACLEAMLMVADRPLQAGEMAPVLGVGERETEGMLERLRDAYARERRGFELRRTARGWQLVSRADLEPVVAAFVTEGHTARLSQAALEALAIIAYRQPITRAQVAAIRGVGSDGVIRALLVRGLVQERGEDAESHAALLVTTELFLDRMGFGSLDDLPSLAPFLPGRADAVGDARERGAD